VKVTAKAQSRPGSSCTDALVDTAPSAAWADARSSDSQPSKPVAFCAGWKTVTTVVETMTAA
jgi:hypothetical protein